MTDNEIKKALYDYKNSNLIQVGNGKVISISDIIDLINRLQAENERLKNHIQEGIDLAKQLPEMLAITKAEAYKEFAEKVKEYLKANGFMFCSNVDNLLKEMVGEDK
jgi:hypothetical protein